MSSFVFRDPASSPCKFCTLRKLIFVAALIVCICVTVLFLTSSHLKRRPFFQGRQQLSYSSKKNQANEGMKLPVKWILLHAVDQLPFKTMTPSSLLLEDLYFIPSQYTYEVYNNSILHQPQADCNEPPLLLILVPSHPDSVHVRRAIRETWGSVGRGRTWPGRDISFPVKLIFVLGVGEHDRRTELEKNVSRSLSTELAQERLSFGDVLQLDMFDSYKNLTRKMILALHWTLKWCEKAKFILKADQDVFVNVPLLATLLKYYGEENSIYGHINAHSWVLRKGKWAVEKSALPIPKYPIYAAGNAYVMSKDVVGKILELAPHFPYIPIEDAFITGILASVSKVNRIKVKGFTRWTEDKPDPCDFVNDKRYVGNNVTEYYHRMIWRELIDKGNDRCDD